MWVCQKCLKLRCCGFNDLLGLKDNINDSFKKLKFFFYLFGDFFFLMYCVLSEDQKRV